MFAGAVLLIGTVAFAIQPASRAWRPERAAPRARGGSLRAPAMRTLIVVLVAVGALFGAVEVAIAAAADGLGSAAAAGPLLGLWGAGSLLGGLVAVRRGGGAHGGAGLSLVLGALTVGHLMLVPAAGSVLAMAAVLLVAGAAIAPTYATVYAMVDRAAPAGTATEAFAWLATAVAIGAAAGAAVAGRARRQRRAGARRSRSPAARGRSRCSLRRCARRRSRGCGRPLRQSPSGARFSRRSYRRGRSAGRRRCGRARAGRAGCLWVVIV